MVQCEQAFSYNRLTISLCKVQGTWGMMLDQFAMAMGYTRPISARFLLQNHRADVEPEVILLEEKGDYPEFLTLKGVRYLAGKSSLGPKGLALNEWLDYIDDRLRMLDHSEKEEMKQARLKAVQTRLQQDQNRKGQTLTAAISDYFTGRMLHLGFRVRAPQLAMAQKVAAALHNPRILLAEAGVGTGKTFAYLIPSLHLLEEGIVVSTNTHVLQDQLLLHDIPELARFDLTPSSALVAKGKTNYLCQARLLQGGFPKEAQAGIQQILEWAATGNFEGSTLRGVPKEIWELVSSSRNANCQACKIGERSGCQYHQARGEWRKGKGVLITNHNQLLAAITAWKAGKRGVFPIPKALVIDEAHNFVGAVEDHLTMRLEAEDEARISDLVQRLSKSDLAVPEKLLGELKRLMAQVVTRIPLLKLADLSGEDEGDRLPLAVFPPILAEELYQLANAARKVVFYAEKYGDRPIKVDYLDEVAETCSALIGPQALRWVEGTEDNRKLCVLSQDADVWLRANLFDLLDIPMVFVSATMSVGGDFSYIKSKLGLSKQRRLESLSVPSCFDYDTNVRFAIPSTMPIFRHETAKRYYQAAFKHVAEVIERVQGNTLVLFTSKESVRAAQKYFANHPLQEAYRLLFQTGESGTQALVHDFKGIPGSCLFGTAFWEGLDVPGKKLSTVIVMKLPFPHPSPLLEREEEKARKLGLDPRESVLLPKMLLRLKQGIGRLIRHEEDRGTIVILDRRTVGLGIEWANLLPYRTEPPIIASLDALEPFGPG